MGVMLGEEGGCGGVMYFYERMGEGRVVNGVGRWGSVDFPSQSTSINSGLLERSGHARPPVRISRKDGW